MSGPFRLVFTIIWFAIGLATVGTLKDCTMVMAGKAVHAHQSELISYSWWNRQLVGKKK